jgi:hypothetical protein
MMFTEKGDIIGLVSSGLDKRGFIANWLQSKRRVGMRRSKKCYFMAPLSERPRQNMGVHLQASGERLSDRELQMRYDSDTHAIFSRQRYARVAIGIPSNTRRNNYVPQISNNELRSAKISAKRLAVTGI